MCATVQNITLKKPKHQLTSPDLTVLKQSVNCVAWSPQNQQTQALNLHLWKNLLKFSHMPLSKRHASQCITKQKLLKWTKLTVKFKNYIANTKVKCTYAKTNNALITVKSCIHRTVSLKHACGSITPLKHDPGNDSLQKALHLSWCISQIKPSIFLTPTHLSASPSPS